MVIIGGRQRSQRLIELETARVTKGELQIGRTGYSTSSSKRRIGTVNYTSRGEMAI